MKIKKSELKFILNELADLLEFAEIQYRDGLVDGAHDPYMNIVRSKRVLTKYRDLCNCDRSMTLSVDEGSLA